MTDAAALLSFADELADAARAITLPLFKTNLTVDAKAGVAFDPVTAADKGAEEKLRAMIEARFPAHGIIGEEFPAKPSQDGYTWYLDPIDGTRAFISGLPLWGVLIGLVFEGRPIIGIIDQPYLNERYRGWPGGADVVTASGGKALRGRPCAELGAATLSTTDPHLFTGAEENAFHAVRKASRLTRYGCDCYAYAQLAAGNIDVVIETSLGPWDIAAIIPVIEGAGGSVTNWRGEPVWKEAWFSDPKGRGNVIAAGDARVRDEALKMLAAR
jgi:myo-inositol-1(or 4)-monophosphatase